MDGSSWLIAQYLDGTHSSEVLLAFKSREPPGEGTLVGVVVFPAGEAANVAQAAARWHLVAQWPRYHSKPFEYTQEELGRLLDNLKEAVAPPDWPAKLAEALRESRANARLMQPWLHQQATEGQP